MPRRGSRRGSPGGSPSWSRPRTRTEAGHGSRSPRRPGDDSTQPRGDLLATARVVWALTAAEALGQGADPSVLDQATKYLEQALAGLDAGELTARAEVLHALALRNRARFESVNALLRNRQVLSDRTLALLAMTLLRLDHAGTADEVLDTLAARAGPSRPAPAGRRYATGPTAWWPAATRRERASRPPRLAALAFARVRPAAVEASGGPRLAAGASRRQRLAPLRGPGPGLAGTRLGARRGSRRRGSLSARRRRSTTPRSSAPRSRAPRRAARSRAPPAAQAGRREPRGVRHRGPRQLRVRRHALRHHPRLRRRAGTGRSGRTGPGRWRSIRGRPPPRLPGCAARARRPAAGDRLQQGGQRHAHSRTARRRSPAAPGSMSRSRPIAARSDAPARASPS